MDKETDGKDNDIRDDRDSHDGFDNDDMTIHDKEHMFKKHVQN